MGFSGEIEAAITLLGGPEDDRVVDFLADPGGACRALDAVPDDGGIVIRAAAELGEPTEGFGPRPADPVWLRVMRGARQVGTAELRGVDGAVRRAARVELEAREASCCDAPGCDRARTETSVWLVLEGLGKGAAEDRLLVAEQRAIGGEATAARAVGVRLARAIEVPFVSKGEPVEDKGELPPRIGEPLGAAELGRFALRGEGDRVVMRDLSSDGPRASAARNRWIGAALIVAAAAFWYQLARALGSAAPTGTAIMFGVLGALFTLAGYAFLGVARFSARYSARSTALWAVGRDQLIVLPWVNRDGAVDLRPEGRLGAAIPLGEVRAASPQKRRGGVAVTIDTDHGAIDAAVCESEASARLWCGALDRAIDEARHPRAGASAKQRARAKAQTATA
jgi:hypothetical protein